MKTAEVKSKRVRHCYPREEVYHRFIHSDELVYHRDSKPIWGHYNYLFVGDCKWYKNSTKEDIESNWSWRKDSCLAVIDREKKKIVFNVSYSDHYWSLKRAIPDDYQVFVTDDVIPYYNIFDRKHLQELYKINAKYFVEQFTKYVLSNCYKVLYYRGKLLYCTPDDFTSRNRHFKDIIDFARTYNLQKYKWYKTSLNTQFKIYPYKEWWKSETIAIPSLEQIFNNTIFSEEEYNELDIRRFYTKYGYNEGISFKTIKDTWNHDLIDITDFKNYMTKLGFYEFPSDLDKYNTWTEAIECLVEYRRNIYAGIQEENLRISNENLEKAKAEYAQKYNLNDVESWRNNNYTTDKSNTGYITYRCWEYNSRGNGKWINKKYYTGNNHTKFDNIQLKLNNNNVVTSNYASVPYDSAKELWRKLIIWLNSNNFRDTKDLDFTSKHIKVGIYNLRRIVYTDKITDSNKPLGYKDICIIIGCHHIWMKEIIDFIEYYKIQKDFPLIHLPYKLLNYERNK